MDGWPALGLIAVPQDEDSPATPAERARWAAVDASFHDAPVTDLAQAWVEEELRVIEAAESLKAWADAQGLAALRRLHEAVGMVVQEQADSISMYTNDAVSYQAVAAETTDGRRGRGGAGDRAAGRPGRRRLELALDRGAGSPHCWRR